MSHDLTNWPKVKNGRYLCSPSKPRPPGVQGRWHHESQSYAGASPDGSADVYRCDDCAARWKFYYDMSGV